MLNNLTNIIFAKEKSLEIVAPSKFNHCSSVCSLSIGNLLTWYSGSGECQNDQSVYIIFIGKNTHKKQTNDNIIRIGDKTGNPIIWSTGNNNAILLYSKFEDTGKISRIIDRWKYCSLWIQHIEVKDKIRLIGKPIKIVNEHDNLLARCNPIKFKDKLLIPLYNEVTAEGCIVEFIDNAIYVRGYIGNKMIQPTIWSDGDTLCSLSRNFKSHRVFSQYSESSDIGKIWSEPCDTNILNNNSSLHTINFDGSTYLIWNDTNGRYRKRLSIGEIDKNKGKISVNKIEVIGHEYGSYPSMSSYNNVLSFSFTSFRKIIYHEWNRKALRNRRRDTIKRRSTRT